MTDGYLNIQREHWFYCGKHKKKWCVGSNRISTWIHEDETTWQENWELLTDYLEVEPARG
jgi:hypothetical protein